MGRGPKSLYKPIDVADDKVAGDDESFTYASRFLPPWKINVIALLGSKGFPFGAMLIKANFPFISGPGIQSLLVPSMTKADKVIKKKVTQVIQ